MSAPNRLEQIRKPGPMKKSSMKSQFLPVFGGLVILSALCGCDTNPKSGRGFHLPDGNVEKGKQAFLELKCTTCHRVEGVNLPPPVMFNLTLGGRTSRVRTYGELVTAIINPSHIVSKKYKSAFENGVASPMPRFNHEMTVEQLIDLVAFLQSRYVVEIPEYKPYSP